MNTPGTVYNCTTTNNNKNTGHDCDRIVYAILNNLLSVGAASAHNDVCRRLLVEAMHFQLNAHASMHLCIWAQ